MECSCCERKIKKGEAFYKYSGEYYCEDCVEEETITYYVVGGGDPLDENEVEYFEDKGSLIRDLKDTRKRLIDEIQENKVLLKEKIKTSNEDKYLEEYIISRRKRELKECEKELRELKREKRD